MSKSKNAGKYQSIEKILYLSTQGGSLNVCVNEGKDTDLNVRVNALCDSGCLVLSATDDADNYYTITEKGRIKLLKLQIKERKKLGKHTDLHEFQLEELLEVYKG